MSQIRALLLDIEGTTTPVSFVYDTLFPFARRRVRDFLLENRAEVLGELEALRAEHEREQLHQRDLPEWLRDEDVESAVKFVFWLMDQDRKSTALKSLQGKIWEQGYRSGQLRGLVYDDVPRAFERWDRTGTSVAIFSSGSVLAQKLLFEHTSYGDLTRFISAYFDTNVGSKKEAESYRRIARAVQLPANEILFCSDVVAELDAASEATMATALCVRDEGRFVTGNTHRAVHAFDALH